MDFCFSYKVGHHIKIMIFFNLEIILDLQKNCKDNTEKDHILFTQLYLTSYTIIGLLAKENNICSVCLTQLYTL